MNSSFLAIAANELEDAVFYYERKTLGLGFEFLEEIYSTLERIFQFPNAWTKISRRCRRCILSRFPYAIIYFFNENNLLIVGISHLNQKPKKWENRF